MRSLPAAFHAVSLLVFMFVTVYKGPTFSCICTIVHLRIFSHNSDHEHMSHHSDVDTSC
jgi:hypothetical protein